VTAPGDGFPVGVTLEAGNRVSIMSPAMAYVVTSRNLIVGINQIFLRHIKSGQPVEITLKLLPGKMLTGTVEGLVLMTLQGQLAPSGQVPLAPTGQDPPAPFGVMVVPDEEAMAMLEELGNLPGGATGTAAIYTESAGFSHMIRKVILRLEMWLNFVSPV
jgi:hypothetical protein